MSLLEDQPDIWPDGPACRACGCTEHNACYRPDIGACSWAEPPHSRNGPLCSHCAASPAEAVADLAMPLPAFELAGLLSLLAVGLAAYVRWGL